MVGGGANETSYFGQLCYSCILLKINYQTSNNPQNTWGHLNSYPLYFMHTF